MAFYDQDGEDVTNVYMTTEMLDNFVGTGLWSCGYNTMGQLGQNDIVPRSSPVQVGSLTNWKSVASGYRHTVAISEGNGF
jgi:alpha-tubulin suppressor-like RCC1 family protein